MRAVHSSRRELLRWGFGAFALPWLPSLAAVNLRPPRRLLIVGTHLGFHPPGFFPGEDGAGDELPPTLRPLEPFRGKFTVLSHLHHPQIRGGHDVVYTLLSGLTKEEGLLRPDGNVSLDQVAAVHAAPFTRFRAIGTALGQGMQMSWDRSGTSVPAMNRPQKVFHRLFGAVPPRQLARERLAIDRERSVLDGVAGQLEVLRARLGADDRRTLDRHLESVRGVELELERSSSWLDRPKPEPPAGTSERVQEEDGRASEELSRFLELAVLALKTDSTRVYTLEIPIDFPIHELGVMTSYHKLSHHGNDPSALAQLGTVESFLVERFASLLADLSSVPAEDGSPLLDHTLVVLAGGLGDANTHSNRNLPILLAGGGLEHAGHLSCAPVRARLCNLWLSVLQWFGAPVESFGTSRMRLEVLGL